MKFVRFTDHPRYLYKVAQYDRQGRVRVEPAENIPPRFNRAGWVHLSWLTEENA